MGVLDLLELQAVAFCHDLLHAQVFGVALCVHHAAQAREGVDLRAEQGRCALAVAVLEVGQSRLVLHEQQARGVHALCVACAHLVFEEGDGLALCESDERVQAVELLLREVALAAVEHLLAQPRARRRLGLARQDAQLAKHVAPAGHALAHALEAVGELLAGLLVHRALHDGLVHGLLLQVEHLQAQLAGCLGRGLAGAQAPDAIAVAADDHLRGLLCGRRALLAQLGHHLAQDLDLYLLELGTVFAGIAVGRQQRQQEVG